MIADSILNSHRIGGSGSLSLTKDGADYPHVRDKKNKLFFQAQLADLTAKLYRVDFVGAKIPAVMKATRTICFSEGDEEVESKWFFKSTIVPVAILRHGFPEVYYEDVELTWSFFFKTDEEAVEFKLKYL